jgi:hypothetical protein
MPEVHYLLYEESQALKLRDLHIHPLSDEEFNVLCLQRRGFKFSRQPDLNVNSPKDVNRVVDGSLDGCVVTKKGLAYMLWGEERKQAASLIKHFYSFHLRTQKELMKIAQNVSLSVNMPPRPQPKAQAFQYPAFRL